MLEALVLSEALKNADVEGLSDTERCNLLIQIPLLDSGSQRQKLMCLLILDADADASRGLFLDAVNDQHPALHQMIRRLNLQKLEALTEADCDSLNETLHDADSDSETLMNG